MISLLWALLSSVAYGVSDFVGGAASRRAPAIQIVLISYPVSAVLVAVVALFVPGTPTPIAFLWGAASGVVMSTAMWAFYAALAAGPMSVVSPLTAVIVTIVPAAVGIFLGERPSVLALWGVVGAIFAVILVSKEAPGTAPSSRRMTLPVTGLTVLAGLAFALSFVFTGQIPAGTGLWPLVVTRGTASVLVFLVALARRRVGRPAGRALAGAICVGGLDVIANTAMLFAFQSGTLSIGSAVIALYPAVTVTLAIVVLRERVARWQIAGLVLAAVAIVIISLNA